MALGGDTSRHGMWSNRWMFVLAAAGSAVGLGNIWKFPYMAGENGGGAFILVYLACVFIVGIPIMMAETLMGRETRSSPINTMRQLVEHSKARPAWVLIGWMGVAAGFLILSFYGVIAGWTVHYVLATATGAFEGASGAQTGQIFSEFLGNPWLLIGWQTLFMVLTIWIVSRGISGGIELAIKFLMPLLFVLLLGLLGYSVTTAGFRDALVFMFSFDPSQLGVEGVLDAMGQAFFTLSLGMGAIMAYGAYVPADAKLTSTVGTIALLDTFVATASGVVVFSLVFTFGLEPGDGPGLMFVTLPLAFGQMPFGAVIGTVFFVLVSFAALTSAISLTEPALAWLVEDYNAKRRRVAISLGVICWFLGLGTVFSFNLWSEWHLVGEKTFFDVVDFAANNVLLPLGGMLIALFAGFALPKTLVQSQLGHAGWRLGLFLFLLRFIAPAGVLAVFGYTIWTAVAG
ncbi:MAG: sodium-dependent transporter [Pseudomonadales bacterium]|jgi:NSS family neurotransmitter:Na+ symporter|nr:sodium-dependent transporter [Pseudomonadales bacterium]